MKKLHVLFLSSWYPTKVNPTNGDFVQRHAEAAALTNNVFLMHVAYNSEQETFLKINIQEKHGFVETVAYFHLSKYLKIFKPFVFIHLYFKLLRNHIKNNGKPDLVHVNIIYPIALIANLFSFFYKIPFVITEHWTAYLEYSDTKISFFKQIMIRLFSKASLVVMPVSEDLAQAMLVYGINREYSVIPNVVDTTLFYPREKKNKNKITILHVSHLRDEHKNISGIIETLSELKKTRKDFELQVVSEDYGENLLNLAKTFGVKDEVKFLGYKNREQLAEIMGKADFLLLFSNYENLPCVIVEAFASGMPVVSSNVGGISEHLNEKRGILVEPQNVPQLVAALNKMCDSYATYSKEEIAKYAQNNFSYTSVSKHLTNVYNYYYTLNRIGK